MRLEKQNARDHKALLEGDPRRKCPGVTGVAYYEDKSEVMGYKGS